MNQYMKQVCDKMTAEDIIIDSCNTKKKVCNINGNGSVNKVVDKNDTVISSNVDNQAFNLAGTKITNNSNGIKTDESITKFIGTDYNFKHEVLWINAFIFLILHVCALYGFYLLLIGRVPLITFFWVVLVGYVGGEGITVGAHRLFTHRTYTAKPALRAALVLMQTVAGQNSMYTWVRDHRVHHRYSDTDADPHNSRRGFFFCHIGWLMSKKHPYVKEYGKRVDMSDLEADWMIRFQYKYFLPLYLVLGVLIPVCVPVYCWNESWKTSIFFCYFARYVAQLNNTWFVNSLAHLYGTRPYDKKIQPVESWFVSMVTLGEGWHNYHHAFPWDYKCAELTEYFNLSATFIQWFEKMGWAYDLKTASPEMVNNRIIRTGDGSHFALGTDEARAAVTAFGPVHPLNPLYNTTIKPPKTKLKPEGLPLFHEKDTLNFKMQDRSTTAG